MSSDKEYQWHNPIFPLKNSTGMRDQANLLVGFSGIVQNIASLFRDASAGNLYTIQPDGAKVYVAFSSNERGLTIGPGLTGFGIDPGVTGTGPQVCFPIPDGVMVPGYLTGGKEVGSTGTLAPTLVSSYNILHARVASGGVSTAYLRIYRSSLGSGQDAGFFRPIP